MKAVLTGASGFVGKHVLRQCLKSGVSPVLLVRETSILPEEAANMEVVRCDFATPPQNLFERLGCPCTLIHLAWGGLPAFNSLSHFTHEVPMHYGLIQNLVTSGLGRVLVAGTCLEYGLKNGPLREDMVTDPCTPYGFAKSTLRQQLEFLRSEKPFDLVWMRLFYLHGEGQSPKSLIPQLEAAVMNGRKSFPMSSGEQIRDFLPVEVAADYILKIASLLGFSGTVNVCSGEPVSVRRFVERWLEKKGYNIRLDLGKIPHAPWEPLAFWGDASKLEKICNGKLIK